MSANLHTSASLLSHGFLNPSEFHLIEKEIVIGTEEFFFFLTSIYSYYLVLAMASSLFFPP